MAEMYGSPGNRRLKTLKSGTDSGVARRSGRYPDWLEEILAPTIMVRLVWLVIGLCLGLVAVLVGLWGAFLT